MHTHAHLTTTKKPNKEVISHHFKQILCELGIKDDQNTIGTADRIAKLYVDEACGGRYVEKPNITRFQIDEQAPTQNHLIGPIPVRSLCSHHFAPVIGECHIGIYTSGKITVGLSKWNRLVHWYAARPQMQEQLCANLSKEIEALLQDGLYFVHIKAQHTCLTWRGVSDKDTRMVTEQTNMVSEQADQFRKMLNV